MADSKEAGVWNDTEFRIHLGGRKNNEVDVRVARKKEVIISERDSRNLIARSKLPRKADPRFTTVMDDGFLVVIFDRLSFGRKIWKVLLGGAILVGAIFGCVSDVEDIADRHRGSDDQTND
ncbi:hypothetical protein WN944_001115 [Citrus x changshan-huyou]|uniref:Uncharacterized protein n=1 Tax=Citrus x changshan-huyou TaxID=2935761 RepID=A0AAP0ME43_9ROSI